MGGDPKGLGVKQVAGVTRGHTEPPAEAGSPGKAWGPPLMEAPPRRRHTFVLLLTFLLHSPAWASRRWVFPGCQPFGSFLGPFPGYLSFLQPFTDSKPMDSPYSLQNWLFLLYPLLDDQQPPATNLPLPVPNILSITKYCLLPPKYLMSLLPLSIPGPSRPVLPEPCNRLPTGLPASWLLQSIFQITTPGSS